MVGLPDLFDGGIATTIEDAERQMRANFETGGARLRQAIAELVAHPAVDGKAAGAVGFSYGGFHLLNLLSGASLPLRAVVTYYATHQLPAAHVPVMAHLAADDSYESAEDMDALRTGLAASGPPNIVYAYPGTKHWFAEADRPEFDAAAATLAFERTVGFLKG